MCVCVGGGVLAMPAAAREDEMTQRGEANLQPDNLTPSRPPPFGPLQGDGIRFLSPRYCELARFAAI